MPFEMLSEPIRRYVRDKRWESLRPIQGAAIKHILSTDCHFILASKTASGKTEAAFLPILSKVKFSDPGVQVLYISPLIALINDQFHRVEELCKYLDVKVTKWHGEANRTDKKKLVQNPEGIVLITPESIEAMLVNAPYSVKALFSNLKYVVIDEIHSFIGTDRGIHLKSLLARLGSVNKSRFNVVGLSATIGDYAEAKKFTGDENNTKVLLDKSSREMITSFKYFDAKTVELPLEMVKDLYKQTCNNKVLIFPNSRGRAEEIAVKLLKISERVNGHANYFSHHSSVDKEVREYVEHFAKNNQRQNFCISCTSTLELGIDIGTVEKVVQVDTTNSIASLIQRVGRSGRRDGETSQLLLYATDKWSLLQSLACWLLYIEGFVEPFRTSDKPYDLLLHQSLSTVKEMSGCTKGELIERLKRNHAFTGIPNVAIQEILDELVGQDWLEVIHRELIVGVEGEKVVNSREFYSVFKSEPNFKVINAGRTIGEVPLTPQVQENENILLAARIWKIKYVDLKSKKIEVVPAADGKKPVFLGGGGIVDAKIREKMLQVLFDETDFPELNEPSQDVITELRKDFSVFSLKDFSNERPYLEKDGKVILYTFTSTKVNRSLDFLLDCLDLDHIYVEQSSSFTFSIKPDLLPELFDQLLLFIKDVDSLLGNALEENESLLDFSKWGGMLPLKYKGELLKERFYDFEATQHFLSNLKLVGNKGFSSVLQESLPESSPSKLTNLKNDLVLSYKNNPDQMSTENYDSLAFRKYTTRSEADKAINSLKGILQGIKLDGEVNDSEIKEMQGWCITHYDLINRNPFKELMLVINEAVKEDANRPELMEDLLWLCQKYEPGNEYYDAATADLQVLQGICHGILSDGMVNDKEVKQLGEWLDGHAHLYSYYPYDEISSLIGFVLADGKVDEEERKRLMAYFNEFTRLTNKELTRKIEYEISQVKISGICTSNPTLQFDGRSFCFTGVFERATRKELEDGVANLGGLVSSTVTKNTDYLIVGDGGNPCWAFACYGRKVEKAIAMRKAGSRISLVHENDFWNLVEELG